MTLFWVTWWAVITQRFSEMLYAKSNEKRLLRKGGIEYGAFHYKWLVLMHVLFFASLAAEWLTGARVLSPWWMWLLGAFLIVQVFRGMVFQSLGRFWNTKIIVLPGAAKVKRGLYAGKVRHPNYLIVSLELLLLPLIFQAYVTAFVFTVSNAGLLMFVRIPAEEEALGKGTIE